MQNAQLICVRRKVIFNGMHPVICPQRNSQSTHSTHVTRQEVGCLHSKTCKFGKFEACTFGKFEVQRIDSPNSTQQYMGTLNLLPCGAVADLLPA